MATTTKPGVKTSEFWTMIGSNIIGILALTGVIATGQADTVNHAFAEIVGALFAVVSNGAYIVSRGIAKKS